MPDRACVFCGRQSDPTRGWMKASASSTKIYWACNDCLDNLPFTVDWNGEEFRGYWVDLPVVTRYYVAA